MRAGVVVFLGVFGALVSAMWCGCSSSSSASAFGGSDAAADTSACKVDPVSGSVGDCPCGTIADFCSQGTCISSLADAQDAAAWGPLPNCVTEESTNTCASTIELRQPGVDTSSTLYLDATSGALVAVVNVNNLKWSCWGTVPGGSCNDTWTLAPRFGIFDGGVCYGIDSPDAD